MPEQEKQDSTPLILAPATLRIADTSGHISATFNCQYPECSNIAASVELISKGTPHPDDQFLHRELLEGESIGGVGQIIIKGFLQNCSMPLAPTTYQQVAAALRSGDLEVLYTLNKDYAPFYCRRCPGVFCAPHYDLEEVWDEAGPDYWHGACPNGHGKFIDH